MRPALLVDQDVVSRPIAGLAHRRVQAEIADQLVRRGEAGDVADGGQHPNSHHHVHAADGHQPPDPVILQSPLGQSLVANRQIPGAVVQIGQVSLDRQLLIRRRGLGLQLGPARGA